MGKLGRLTKYQKRRKSELNMERLLSISRELRDKVQENESAASELLKQSEELREELKAMRQVSARESEKGRIAYVCFISVLFERRARGR